MGRKSLYIEENIIDTSFSSYGQLRKYWLDKMIPYNRESSAYNFLQIYKATYKI